MGMFRDFENRAKDRLQKSKENNPNINQRKFKPQQNNFHNERLEDIKDKDESSNEELDDFDRYDEGGFDFNDKYNGYDDINLMPAQKSESFHFFILENQYRDLERAIRGVKDVWDKDKEKWVIKKKANHCFTDEESEEIVRTAQSHLSTDIKLGILSRDEYPILLNAIYDQLWVFFKSIMEYRFARHGNFTKQMEMKQQAANIFNTLMMRIKVNYSRALEGRENKATHDSVKGQESLQQTERKQENNSYT